MAANRVLWRSALPGCLLAGVLSALGMMVPSVPVMGLFMIAGGGLAVTLYRRRQHAGEVTASQGFRIGTLAGFCGALLISTVSVLGFTSAGNRGQMRQMLGQKLQEAAGGGSDPQTLQTVQRLNEMLSRPNGLTMFLAFGLFLMLIFFLMLSGAGGALGARLFGRHQPHS